MEGISYEAASLAGSLKLGHLIVLYDSNNITMDGSKNGVFTEDVLKRFPNKTASRIRGCTRLNSVSFFELIDTSACIHKFLSACEEGVAFTANINFQHVGILRRTRRESRSASANDLHFVIFRMNVSFHIFHLTRYYTDLRMILYPFFYLSSTDFGIQTKILAY